MIKQMKDKIKVMYLTTTSKLCGSEKILMELAKRIDKEYFEIMVITIKDDLREGLLEKLRGKGIKTACLGVDKRWKFYKLWRLFPLIKEFKPDIIESFLFFDNILARIFGKLMSVPVIITGQRNVETNRFLLRNLLDKRTIRLSNLIISNTERGKELLVQKYGIDGDRVKIIYNGIEIDDEKAPLPEGKFLLRTGLSGNEKIVGFIGRLEKQKGVQHLVDAVKIIYNQDPSVYALIVGDGKERESLEKYSKSNGENSANIVFSGWIDNASQFIKLFKVLVLPSLWEGMPNVILEAMTKEVPVITTNVGGISEVIDDGKDGFLVEPGNSLLLADKIKYVLSLSDDERQRITRAAKNRVISNFNIERMVREFENSYFAILSNKSKI